MCVAEIQAHLELRESESDADGTHQDAMSAWATEADLRRQKLIQDLTDVRRRHDASTPLVLRTVAEDRVFLSSGRSQNQRGLTTPT